MAQYLIGNIKGAKGDPGFSPTVTVETVQGGAKITATDVNGTTVANIRNGIDASGESIDLSPYATKVDLAEVASEIPDMEQYATKDYLEAAIPTKLSELDNDTDFLIADNVVTSINGLTGDVLLDIGGGSSEPLQETDPTVPAWAKQESKPRYEWSEIYEKPFGYIGDTLEVNNGVLDVVNGAAATETDPVFSASPAASITAQNITDWDAKSDFSGDYDDLTNKPDLSVYATTTALGTGLARKQDTLTAGEGIQIDNNNEISLDTDIVPLKADLPTPDGTTITNNNGVWSAVGGGGGATYTAGDGIDIYDDTEIRNTNPFNLSGVYAALFQSGSSTPSWGTAPTGRTTIGEIAYDLLKVGISMVDGYSLFSGVSPAAINAVNNTNWVFKIWTRDTTYTWSSRYEASTSTSNLAQYRKNSVFIKTGKTEVAFFESLAVARNALMDNIYNGIWVKAGTNFSSVRLPSAIATLDTAISNKQDALPAITNNQSKVLAVNSNATGLEWVEQSAGGSEYGDADVADYISDTFGMGVSGAEPTLWGQTSDPQYIGEDSEAEITLTGSGSTDPFQGGGNTQYPVEFEIRQNSNDELVSSVNETFFSHFTGSEVSPAYHFSSEDGNKSFDLTYYSDAWWLGGTTVIGYSQGYHVSNFKLYLPASGTVKTPIDEDFIPSTIARVSDIPSGGNYGDEDVADYIADNFGLEYSSVNIPVGSHNFTAPKGSQNTIIQGAPNVRDMLRTIEVGEVNIYDANNTVLGTLQAQTWYGGQGGAGPNGWGSSYTPASGEYGITFTMSAMAENNYVPVITYTRVEAFDFDHITGSITLGGKSETIGKLQDKFLPNSALTTTQLNSNNNLIRQPVLNIISNQFGMGTRTERQIRENRASEQNVDSSGVYTTNMEIMNPANLTKSDYVSIFFDGGLAGTSRSFSSRDGVYSSIYTYNDVNYTITYDSMNNGLWTVNYPTDIYNTVSKMFIVHCYNESVQVERPLRAEYLPIDTECLMIDNGVLTINKSWLYNFVQNPYDPNGGGSSKETITLSTDSNNPTQLNAGTTYILADGDSWNMDYSLDVNGPNGSPSGDAYVGINGYDSSTGQAIFNLTINSDAETGTYEVHVYGNQELDPETGAPVDPPIYMDNYHYYFSI